MPNIWIPIREPRTNWLLFKYDPARQLIEIQRRGKKTLVDLSDYKPGEVKLDKPLIGLAKSCDKNETNNT